MRLILGLDEIGADDGRLVGGKAVALARLQRAGRTLPGTFCLTTGAYEIFVESASLRAVIHQELGRKSFADLRWEELWDASLRIRNRFLRAPVPPEIVAAVGSRLEPLPARRALAVRSSAPREDSGSASFAGLHDSLVGIRGLTAATEAIREVWASLWTDRALLYRRELGIDVDSSAMAVIVQELVEGSSSGVAFGVHPNDADLAAVEAVWGLNQGLVDGTIEPDRWSLERRSGRVVEHVAPAERWRLVADGSEPSVEPVPAELAGRPPLDEAGLAEVFAAVGACESLFGAPQDVEWTFDRGRLTLLQSRPITTTASGDGDKRAWYLSLTRSLRNLTELRARVETELLPALDRAADESAAVDLRALGSRALADEIERRRLAHDHWVNVYWRDFIPLAHGVRLFGTFYIEVVRPEDPFEFMELLAATPLLSVRRNRALARLASRIREDPALRRRLERSESGGGTFERELGEFETEFGDAAFESHKCFADRARLVRLLRSMADAPALAEARPGPDVEALERSFLETVPEDRRPMARELLELGRASYRLRDDDNLYLGRLEAQVLDAVAEGRRRLGAEGDQPLRPPDLERVVRALRHPNLVVEPKAPEVETPVEPGFRALPRQLVGQPAGPGVATGVARVVEGVDQLFDFQAGEILVCDAVDPNMTFVVPLAAAVIERRGGMLIHGAIIAREYGLPCVTGVPKATRQIATGDTLTVDGYLGIVTLPRG